MEAAVVHWKAAGGELSLTDLTDAVNWVLEQEPTQPPKVYFTFPSYPHMPIKFKGDTVMAGTGWFAIVVTDEPITESQANEVMAQFYEEDDVRGAPYRGLDHRQSASSPPEPSSVTDRGDGGRDSQKEETGEET